MKFFTADATSLPSVSCMQKVTSFVRMHLGQRTTRLVRKAPWRNFSPTAHGARADPDCRMARANKPGGRRRRRIWVRK